MEMRYQLRHSPVELAGFELGDPLLAKQMRYQLRYSPIVEKSGRAALNHCGPGGIELRPHPYQGCALTT